ncbi:MAG: hypothetical protein ACFCU5_18140 [Pleurocapsa sp.]
MSDRIILGIPGKWPSKREIISFLAADGDRNYQIVGERLIETATNESCSIYFSDRGKQKINGEKSYCDYQQIVYLSDFDCNYKTCLKIARFAKIFLDIGGLAVRVESAGIWRDRTYWLARYNSADVFDIYSLFVVLIEGKDRFYSCGMNHFGKADVSVDNTEETSLAIYVMNVFNYYRLTEFPILKDGQTFQPDLESPMYEIRWTQSDEMVENIHGCWHLSRIGNESNLAMV